MHVQATSTTLSNRSRLFLAYSLIAYAISWAIEIPLALKAQGIISASIPFAIHYLAAFGPFIAGIALTWHESRFAGLKELRDRAVKWRVEPIWWIAAVSPLLLFLIVSLLMRIIQGIWLDFGILGRFDFLPDLGLSAVLLWLATYGFGEELGWRGYLLPRLQRDRSAWSATVILWGIWVTWHAPSFFYLHTASSPGMLIGFLFGVLAGAIVLTWLYNSSGGSILIVAVWHGLFDYVTACAECKSGLIAATVSTLVMIWAIVVVFLYKSVNLSSKERHAL
jgi:membrane protease YdiL (CAAX protease family)